MKDDVFSKMIYQLDTMGKLDGFDQNKIGDNLQFLIYEIINEVVMDR